MSDRPDYGGPFTPPYELRGDKGSAPETPGPAPARIAAVDQGGPAESAGLVAGDAIVTVDDVILRDLIDWRWHADGSQVTLVVHDSLGHERAVLLVRNPGESWGIEFEQVVFDGIRTCRNICPFCFVKQLPKGLRRSLYVRDDDYRLSFLQGNFITLTNLTEPDLQRIEEQRLSPLYVSLHTVDPFVRKQLVCAHDDYALQRFDRLVGRGIEIHVQIVLVPGENDASRLDQTLEWLSQRDHVPSVGVVPLGFTKYQDRFTRSYENRRDAQAVIDQLDAWRDRMRAERGSSWVHAADEFNLNARAPVPSASTYDGFPQLENGIGLVRQYTDAFLASSAELTAAVDSWQAVAASLPDEARQLVLVTGCLFAPVLESLVAETGCADWLRVLPVENRFFGGNVSVTGLLTESDISATVRADAGQGVYLLPDVVANPDGVTLDDVAVQDLGPLSGSDVRLVSSDARGLASGVLQAAEHPPRPRPKSR